ncbi:MAG TPA: hypothetical protein VJ783_12565, partial [Pirellulales bacterium]|nr:hypothetical protein [Pirellulales bacterium]
CKMQKSNPTNENGGAVTVILHFDFCILHSDLCTATGQTTYIERGFQGWRLDGPARNQSAA